MQTISTQQRPSISIAENLKVVAELRTLLGRNPVWHGSDGGKVVLSDSFRPSIIAVSGTGARAEETDVQRMDVLAGVTPEGAAVIVGPEGLSIIDGDARRPLMTLPPDIAQHRFDYAGTDRSGNVVFSTMEARGRTKVGGLYRANPNGSVTTLSAAFEMWSGMDWSVDGKYIYCADTGRQQVLRFRYDPTADRLEDRKVLATFPVETGRPDGVAVDESGCIWVAFWDGWRLIRLRPDGVVDREVILPIPRAVGLCFGGLDRKTLFISTARVRLPPDVLEAAPLSGALLALEVETPGLLRPPVDAGFSKFL
ncbi:SMP-30/gluconolactonase/LRE family protein [Rhizobium sp. 18055]|uniref:SMP-30/gluconolactonase/LRE family protein n=1 Tax=Rhizobium sp. 18055 TaxID=2681403 RepID=UPI00135C266F|nr:SMP-30/gluconolactonase/LRE family protein [Rhizobium sp. 18055]